MVVVGMVIVGRLVGVWWAFTFIPHLTFIPHQGVKGNLAYVGKKFNQYSHFLKTFKTVLNLKPLANQS